MDRRVEASSFARTAAAAGLVLLGCYLGAGADVWLRFPALGAAILFPPYAILTAALWRTEPRSWWILLLAASVGSYLPHRFGGASVGFVLAAELVNHLRAVLAAAGLRRFAGRTGRVETLRGMVAYLAVAVFLAPALAAFAGAGLIVWHGATRTFWLAFQEWWLSNAVTALTLLLLLTVDPLLRRDRVTVRRAAEGALLAVTLFAVGAGVFARSYDRSQVHLAHLYWALPFLLWALRFGARGTSAALLAVTALSIWGAVDGRGPFAARAATENLLELQLFVLAVSIPLLLLASLIEQQRRTAAALVESRRQYRSVVEDQTEMICRLRPDGATTFANRAYREAFGLGADDLLSTGSIWTGMPPGVHASASELAGLTPAAPIATREVCVATAAGTPRWLQWRERGLFDERGALVEVQAVGQDVTDRKRAEDERRELEAQRSVEAALREADRRKDEFLAMLGHELRNPLAPIGIALELLRLAPPGGPDALWARDSIGRQLAHMTRLLDDLLDISRITLGKIRLQLETVDLGRVVANALEATRPFIDTFGHQVVVNLPARPLLVRGDAVRLTQVVSNLLNNAAKYTDRGGRIEIALDRDPAGIRLVVRDNGIGLGADALEEIFELFSQLPSGRERGQGGLGIGLALAKRLVALHGGTVEARSDGPRLGSELVVRLPGPVAPPAALPATATAAAPPPEPGRSLRILAVDDNVLLADGLANLLGLWGHTVRTAYDGDAALELARTFSPEVVLVDLGLPRVDGLEVARRLRARAAQPPALLVSMSGFGQAQTRLRSDEAGFHHHLVKPVDLGSLRSMLEDCVRGRSAGPTG